MLFQGPFAELAEKRKAVTIIDTSDNDRAFGAINDAGFEVRREHEKLLVPNSLPPDISRINRLLVQMGIDVHQIAPGGNDLEKIFVDLIGDSKW